MKYRRDYGGVVGTNGAATRLLKGISYGRCNWS